MIYQSSRGHLGKVLGRVLDTKKFVTNFWVLNQTHFLVVFHPETNTEVIHNRRVLFRGSSGDKDRRTVSPNHFKKCTFSNLKITLHIKPI